MSVNNSIYTNPAAFTALQNLNTINRNLELSQGRVSSGLRVSSALDDSASFSIAPGLRADIKAVDSMRQALTKAKGIIEYTLAAAEAVSSIALDMKAKLTSLADTSLSAVQRDLVEADFTALRSQASAAMAGAARLDEVGGAVVDLFSATATGAASIVFQLNPQLAGASATLSRNELTVDSAATINVNQRLVSSFANSSVNTAALAQSALTATFKNFEAAIDLALGQLGSDSKQVSQQITFLETVKGTRQELLGSYVDADLASESAKLTALQVQQQLAVQAVGIANQRPQSLLGLFR
jgi:flagellin